MDVGTAHNQAEGEGGVQVVLVALGFRDDPAGFQTRGIFLKEMAVVAALILRKATSGNVVSRHGALGEARDRCAMGVYRGNDDGDFGGNTRA